MEQTVQKVINENFKEWDRFIKTKNVDTIFDDRCSTSEDILQEVLLRTLRKYNGVEADEREIFEYVKLTLCTELQCQYRRKDKVILRVGDLRTKNEDEDDE